jgi:hypothetical protein
LKPIRAITILLPLSAVLLCPLVSERPQQSRPLSLHHANPHYFLRRDRPTILITSGEHYGAILDLDFDYIVYLDALARNKLNNTQVFTGAYAEMAGNFSITNNTLAPAPNRSAVRFIGKKMQSLLQE